MGFVPQPCDAGALVVGLELVPSESRSTAVNRASSTAFTSSETRFEVFQWLVNSRPRYWNDLAWRIDEVRRYDDSHGSANRRALPSALGRHKAPAIERLELSVPPASTLAGSSAAHPRRCCLNTNDRDGSNIVLD